MKKNISDLITRVAPHATATIVKNSMPAVTNAIKIGAHTLSQLLIKVAFK